MHIAIDARIMNSSTGRYVERLVHYLEEIDTENRYSILLPKKDLEFYTPKNPNFKIIEADFKNYSLAEQVGLKQLLEALEPDLVHFCMPQQPVFYRGASVTTVHDLTLLKTVNSDKNPLVYRFKQLVGRFVFQHIARSAKHVIVPSDFTLQEYTAFSGINPSKISRIYEAADVPDIPVEPYQPLETTDYIMYVGSQSDYKNVRRLIEAHQLLLQKHPDLHLALVGKLSGQNGKAAARTKTWSEREGHKNVIFTDFVNDSQLAWLYQNTRAYVFPSLMEGFGLPGLEAMLHGAPVASSNATCLPEVYGDAALYFEPTNVIAIADSVHTILSDKTIRDTLIKKGAMQVKKYSWRDMAKETHQVHLDALKTTTKIER